MDKPRALDLFCCAGGAGMGLHRAGFEVVGVDIRPQKNYPFEFHQADALTFPTEGFDFIWASPPCQAHTSMKTMRDARPHPDLIPQTREKLKKSGALWCIENVVGAPLENPFTLCGTMFGLGVGDAELRRHRNFEAPWIPRKGPDLPCVHGNYGRSRTIGIYGEGCRDSRRKYDKSIPEFTVEQGREAMGIGWMTIAELCEAIPPAYSQFIGMIAMRHLRMQEAA